MCVLLLTNISGFDIMLLLFFLIFLLSIVIILVVKSFFLFKFCLSLFRFVLSYWNN